MNIIIATTLYPPEIENLAIYTKELSQKLKNEHNISVIAYSNMAEDIPGARIITVSKMLPIPLRILKYSITLLKTARQADLIYVQNAVAAGLPAIIAQSLLKIPVILNFAEDESWKNARRLNLTDNDLPDFLKKPRGNLKIRLISFIQKFVLKRAKIITVPSQKFAEIITDSYHLPKNRIFVNYSPPKKEIIIPFSSQFKKHQIVTIAPLNRWSGLTEIIQSINLLAKKFDNLHLVIIGEGPEENNLKELVNKLKLDDKIIFLGYASLAEAWHICKSSDVYLLNSSSEYYPDLIQKGFAAGIPVVAPDKACFNEIIKDKDSGLLFKPDDQNSIVEAISFLLTHQDFRKKIIQKAQESLVKDFSWSAHIKKLNYLFNLATTSKK